MKKIGLSLFNLQKEYGDKRAIEIAKELGADAVDIDTDHYSMTNPDCVYSKSDEEIFAYFSELGEYAASIGIEVSQTHGRLRIFKNDPALDPICLEDARRDLLAAKALGAPFCVMHGVSRMVLPPNPDPEMILAKNRELFGIILKFAKRYGVKVATETCGGAKGEFKNTFDIISKTDENGEWFTTCMDTGHVNKGGAESVGEAIRILGKDISCLHLHDNNGKADNHRPLFCGTTDWNDALDAFDEIGYEGVYNLEINLPCFGKGFELETGAFGIKMLRNIFKTRYVE